MPHELLPGRTYPHVSCATVDRQGVGARADDEDEVVLGREMALWKLKVGIARCFRLQEPSYDIPRSSHWEYRTRSSDESESGESLLLTTMAPSASVPSPAGAGVMRVGAA